MYYSRAARAFMVATAAFGLTALSAPFASAQPPAKPAMAPIALPLSTIPPKGAIVLVGSNADEFKNTWYNRRSTDTAKWKFDKGVITPEHIDITTKQEFGDCYLHVEFATPKDAAIGHGNAGVGLQGRYEIQILNDYGQAPESHAAGALYSQKPAMVNASKKAGEWQTYDIIFRAPRFDASGAVTEKPRVTVFQNGIIVQNNAEFTDMTGINYEQYKAMTPTGPLVLQGDHEPVQYRNVWIVPM